MISREPEEAMTRARVLMTAGLIAALVPLTGASAQVEGDHDLGVIEAGESTTWTGDAQSGINLNYHGGFLVEAPREVAGTPDTCSKDPNTYCDTAVVELSNPLEEDDPRTNLTRQANVRIDAAAPWSDLDLAVYEIRPDGTRGAQVGRGGCPCPPDNPAGMWEEVSFSVRTTHAVPSKRYLIEVVYWAAAATGYEGSVSF
jgi:hypothetical protein